MVIWKRTYGICTKRNWIGPIIMGYNGIQLTTIQYDIWGCLEIGDIPKVARSKCLNDDKPLYLRAPYFQTYCGSVCYIMVIDIDVGSIYTVYCHKMELSLSTMRPRAKSHISHSFWGSPKTPGLTLPSILDTLRTQLVRGQLWCDRPECIARLL